MVLQVFEYCTTDLKKYMDRTGKGPSNPLPKQRIKVSPCFHVYPSTKRVRDPYRKSQRSNHQELQLYDAAL